MSDTPNTGIQKAGSQRDLKSLLIAQSENITKLSEGVLNADRLLQLAVLATRKVPALQACSIESIISSCMDAARLGLEPDGVEGALIPYRADGKPVAQFQPMYQGLIALMYRDQTVDGIDLRVAWEGDEFDLSEGSKPFIHHKPNIKRDKDAQPLVYYSVAHLRGNTTFEHMLPFEIEAIRLARPRAEKSSPWDNFYDEMAKKTVLKRHAKKLPKSRRVKAAINHDNEIDGVFAEPTEKPGKIVASSTDKLLGAAGKKKPEAPPVEEPPPEHYDGPTAEEEVGQTKQSTLVPPEQKPLTIDAVAAASKTAEDTAALDALLRAMPKPEAIDSVDSKTRKAPLIAHALSAKSINEATYKVAVLVARHRLGDTTSVPQEREILAAALARVEALGGWLS